MSIVLNLVPSAGPTQDRRDGNEQVLIEEVLVGLLHPRIAQIGKMLQGIVHFRISPRQTCTAYSEDVFAEMGKIF
ncbi:MAG: hypothetical protein ABSG00_00505 [Terracidiphilus sp.]|jgi:hypothetical protein